MLRTFRGTLAAVIRQYSVVTTAEKAVSTGSVSGTSSKSVGRDTLGKRLLSLVYAKRSAVITIQKWKEEGNTARKYELNRIVRELRKHKRYKHALEVCEWMTLQKDIKLLPGDYAVHLDLVGKVRNLASAEKFFEDLPDRMRGSATYTALLHAYVQKKMSTEAEALMEKMSEFGFLKNPMPYNHMLSLYISSEKFDKVPQLIEELKRNTSPDVLTYNLWLSVCASKNDVEAAEKVLTELKNTKVQPDWVTYSVLTNLYLKRELFVKATSALNEMENRASRGNRNAYSSLLTLHTNMQNKDDVHRIWAKMKTTFRKLNDGEYTSMISSLVKLEELEEAEKVYTEWESVSGTRDSRVSNILLAAYINKTQMEKAEIFANRMAQNKIAYSYTTWELLTWGHLKEKKIEKVLHCFKKAVDCLKKWDHEPSLKLVREVLKLLEEQCNIESAEEFLVILREAGHVSTEIYNSLLRTYANSGKMPLIVAERMAKDNVSLDEETHKLIEITSKMCVNELPS